MKTIEKLTITTNPHQTISSSTGEFLLITLEGGVVKAFLRKDTEKAPTSMDVYCLVEGALMPEGACRYVGSVEVEEVRYLYFTPSRDGFKNPLSFGFKVNCCGCKGEATCES
jgi:hypothetical protein